VAVIRRLWVAVVAGAMLVAGCAVPHPKDSHGVTKVAASEAEAEAIYDRYRTVRKSALELLDEGPLTQVESGAVLAIDAGALMVARRLLMSEAPDDTQDLRILDVYAPRLDSYPLWFVAVVEDGVRDLIKVQIFQRESTTTGWQMVASPEILPTTQLPGFDLDDTDALKPVDPFRAGGLAMSPQDAIGAYAAALNNRPDAETEVSDDSFITQMRQVAAEQKQVDGVNFTQQWVPRTVQYAVRSADGGALVFGTLYRVDRYEIEKGRYINWPEGSEQKAFLSGRLYSIGELRYYHQILVYVPPDEGKPVALGQYGGVVDGVGY
jgi:hypothetical protein